MKSTLFNMVMVLFVITLLASAGVGAVHMITEEPIAEARVKATREALKQVLPEFDETEDTALTVENLPVTVHTASEGGRVVGYAVESMTKNGFSGVIRLMVGFAPDGQILNIRVLEQAETPGLGTKMVGAGNPLEKSFVGRNPAQMKLGVKKDGGDVDALTAATISSRAYVDAVSRAYKGLLRKGRRRSCREYRFGCFEYSKCECGRYFGGFGYPRCGSGWCVRCFEQSRNGNGSRDGCDGCSAECRGWDASCG